MREKSPLFWQYFANSLSSIVDNYAILYKGGRSQASKTQVLFSESYFTPKATIHTLLLVGLPWIYEEATHIYIYIISIGLYEGSMTTQPICVCCRLSHRKRTSVKPAWGTCRLLFIPWRRDTCTFPACSYFGVSPSPRKALDCLMTTSKRPTCCIVHVNLGGRIPSCKNRR